MTSIGVGLAAIAVLVIAGRYFLNPMFHLLARFGGREVMTAAALLVVLGAAMLMQAGGLSMAMGAFLAGVLLSESSFRHQLEADIEPFRGLLLGLFFLGVGMALDLNVIAANWTIIAISVPAYMILKMIVIYAVTRLTKASQSEAVERAIIMAQGGEFAFVLYSTATQFGILSAEWNATLTAIIICSMVLTPFMIILYDRTMPKRLADLDGVEKPQDLHGSVLMIGFGRVGQIISQPLLARGHSLSIIDANPEAIRDANEFGFKVFYGDGTRHDILHAAGAAEAGLIIVTVGNTATSNRIVEMVKHEFPMVPVIASAYDRLHARDLVLRDVDYMQRETLLSALDLGREALVILGDTPEDAVDVIDQVKARDGERFVVDISQGVEAGSAMLLSNRGAAKSS